MEIAGNNLKEREVRALTYPFTSTKNSFWMPLNTKAMSTRSLSIYVCMLALLQSCTAHIQTAVNVHPPVITLSEGIAAIPVMRQKEIESVIRDSVVRANEVALEHTLPTGLSGVMSSSGSRQSHSSRGSEPSEEACAAFIAKSRQQMQLARRFLRDHDRRHGMQRLQQSKDFLDICLGGRPSLGDGSEISASKIYGAEMVSVFGRDHLRSQNRRPRSDENTRASAAGLEAGLSVPNPQPSCSSSGSSGVNCSGVDVPGGASSNMESIQFDNYDYSYTYDYGNGTDSSDGEGSDNGGNHQDGQDGNQGNGSNGSHPPEGSPTRENGTDTGSKRDPGNGTSPSPSPLPAPAPALAPTPASAPAPSPDQLDGGKDNSTSAGQTGGNHSGNGTHNGGGGGSGGGGGGGELRGVPLKELVVDYGDQYDTINGNNVVIEFHEKNPVCSEYPKALVLQFPLFLRPSIPPFVPLSLQHSLPKLVSSSSFHLLPSSFPLSLPTSTLLAPSFFPLWLPILPSTSLPLPPFRQRGSRARSILHHPSLYLHLAQILSTLFFFPPCLLINPSPCILISCSPPLISLPASLSPCLLSPSPSPPLPSPLPSSQRAVAFALVCATPRVCSAPR